MCHQGQSLKLYNLTLLPVLIFCFLCMDWNVISQLPAPPTMAFFWQLSCLPHHDWLYTPGTIKQNKLFLLYVAFARVLDCSKRKVTNTESIFQPCPRDSNTMPTCPETEVSLDSLVSKAIFLLRQASGLKMYTSFQRLRDPSKERFQSLPLRKL